MALLENIIITFITGTLFMLTSAPFIYSITSGSSCPNAIAHVLHMVIFAVLLGIFAFVINLFKKSYNKKSIGDILKCILCAGLVYYFFSNKEIYEITDYLPYIQTLDSAGCPTYIGIGLHSIVYMIFIFMYMLLFK